MKKKLLIILLVITLALIWGQSVLDRDQSTKESSWIFEKLEIVMRFIVGPELANERLLRKMAHFGEFFLLSAEATILCILLGEKTNKGISLCYCVRETL